MPETPFLRPVVCAWCANRHRNIIGEPTSTQGDACAASVWRAKDGKWYVQGHYGSSDYDTQRFVFVKDEPSKPADPVCDNCIGERLMAGDLKLVEGSFL